MDKKIKILLVDDEIEVLSTITHLLESETNYEITSINNGSEALLYIESNQEALDIIISDINMDGINGVQLAKIVGELNPKIRIILMSGFISIIDQIKHFEMGIEKILTKPFDIEELVSVIENPVERNELPVSSMIPVKVDSLISAIKIPIDLYVQLSGEKFIKMFSAKQNVDRPRLKQFLAQDVLFLYAKKEDYFNIDLVLYVPTRTSTFKVSRVLNFNVFYIQGEEYKKLIPAGSMLNDGMLKLIKDRLIKVLYIVDKDQSLFLNYLDQTLDEFMKSKDITVEDKLATSSKLVQARIQEVYLNPNRENLLTLKKSQKHLIDFLKVNNSSIKDLLKLNEEDKGVHIHSSMVASLSYALLLEIISMREDKEEKLRIRALDEFIFESDDIKEIVFTGALLHDLGKPLIQMNNNLYDNTPNHPQVAFEKLKVLNVIHPKSLEIIIQHEEFCDGSGFPNKLKKTNISFFSQVVILVNYFDKLRRNQDLSASEAIKEINKIPEKFNKHLIPILARVVTR